MATKIMDLPNRLPSSLMAPSAALAELAKSLGVSMTRMVLSYMLTLPGMTHVIPAASTVAQLEDNAAAGKLALSDEFRARVREALEA